MKTYTEEDIRKAFRAGIELMITQRYFEDESMDEYIESLNQANNNEVSDIVSEPFTNHQTHKIRFMMRDFYLWMKKNDYDHNIPMRVENKAELYLREINVR